MMNWLRILFKRKPKRPNMRIQVLFGKSVVIDVTTDDVVRQMDYEASEGMRLAFKAITVRVWREP